MMRSEEMSRHMLGVVVVEGRSVRSLHLESEVQRVLASRLSAI